MNNKFDLVICTYKRPNTILKCLSSVVLNNLKPKSIIIIDQNFDNVTKDYVINFFFKNKIKNYKYFKNIKRRGLTISKNIAIKYCKSEHIFFLDDDIKINKLFFQNCLSVFNKFQCDGVSGVITNYQNEKFKNFFFHIFNYQEYRDNRYNFINYKKFISKKIFARKVYQVPGGITAFKRTIFNKVKFDEKLITHNYEDVDFNYRLKKIFKKNRLFISYNAMAEDLLTNNNKSKIETRVYFMRLLSLKYSNFKLSMFFYISLFGMLISKLISINFNDIFKMQRGYKKAKIKRIY